MDSSTRNEEIIRQARLSREYEDHSYTPEWYRTRVIDFSLGCIPKYCLQHVVEEMVTEIIKYELKIGKRSKQPAHNTKVKLRRCVKALLLNLWLAENLIGSCRVYTAISKNRNDYYDGVDKEFEGISYEHFISAFDAMSSEHLGCIKVFKEGYYASSAQAGRRTAVFAGHKLLDRISKAVPEGFRVAQEKSKLPKNSIVLRNPDKKSIPYEDTPQIRKWRSNLKKINALHHGADIRFDFPEDCQEGFKEALSQRGSENEHNKEFVDHTQVTMYRVFNNGQFDQGGRFYGAWWQNIPKEYRKYISINGEPTSELDYSEMHLTMMYAEEGLKPPIKPYEPLVGVDRSLGKIAFNALLNTDHRAPKAPKDFNRSIASNNLKWSDFLQKIESYHEAIAHRLRQGYGLELQYRDSQIAEEVMLYFIEKGIVCLPIHDSFIVQSQYEQELGDVMSKVAKELTGVDIKVH